MPLCLHDQPRATTRPHPQVATRREHCPGRGNIQDAVAAASRCRDWEQPGAKRDSSERDLASPAARGCGRAADPAIKPSGLLPSLARQRAATKAQPLAEHMIVRKKKKKKRKKKKSGPAPPPPTPPPCATYQPRLGRPEPVRILARPRRSALAASYEHKQAARTHPHPAASSTGPGDLTLIVGPSRSGRTVTGDCSAAFRREEHLCRENRTSNRPSLLPSAEAVPRAASPPVILAAVSSPGGVS